MWTHSDSTSFCIVGNKERFSTVCEADQRTKLPAPTMHGVLVLTVRNIFRKTQYRRKRERMINHFVFPKF